MPTTTKPRKRATNGKKTPTDKERAFAKSYVKTLNATKSYKEVYNTKTDNIHTVQQEASRTLSKPQVKREIVELMERKGLDDESLLQVHQEGLQSTRGDEPDYSVRHKYLETAYKLKGYTDTDREKPPIQIAIVTGDAIRVDTKPNN